MLAFQFQRVRRSRLIVRTSGHGLFPMLIATLALVVFANTSSQSLAQDDPVFSGPQAGEALPAFEFESLLDLEGSEPLDFVSDSEGGPVTLIFMHELTRPSIGLIRSISEHVQRIEQEELKMAMVMLTDDVTETRNWAQRASRALPQDMVLGVYPDGLEGPGSYGLNRNVSLTVLVANENEVVANYALVQPSVEADGIKIANSINELFDLEPVAQEQWRALNNRRRQPANAMNERMEAQYRQLMAPVIQRDSDQETIDAAARRVEEAAANNVRLRDRVGNAAKTIVESGNLANYGNEFSQAWLKKWAEEWGNSDDSNNNQRDR